MTTSAASRRVGSITILVSGVVVTSGCSGGFAAASTDSGNAAAGALASGSGTSQAGRATSSGNSGGVSNGGVSNGGVSNGGASNGGASNGGASNGGASNGGASNGGAMGGGTSTAGVEETGLPANCTTAACNAATPVIPRYNSYGTLGNVTMYTTQASDGGACQYGATRVVHFAAINVHLAPGDGQGQWDEGRFCGQCVEVTALTSQGAKKVVVRIMDRCADENCGVDLGGAAPAAVMSDGFGRYQGAWRTVSCAGHPEVFDGEPSLFVKEGSNAYWSVIQVRNPMAAVTGIEWQKQADPNSKGSLPYAAPSIENYWTVPAELLQANATYDILVRYSDGSTAAASLTSAQLASAASIYPLR